MSLSSNWRQKVIEARKKGQMKKYRKVGRKERKKGLIDLIEIKLSCGFICVL